MLSGDPNNQETSSPIVPLSHLPESSTDDQDTLTAAWATTVRIETNVVRPHVGSARCQNKVITVPPANAGSSEMKSWVDVIPDSCTGQILTLWSRRLGDFYLALSLVVVVSTVIYWMTWMK